jgi:dTDP-4-amino-4,6-dideoxygalactose transaminase
VSNVICLNSATAGLEIMLRWFGIGKDDEVIVPAYTYSATANVVIHCGAKPVIVDSGPDFNIDPEKIRSAITNKTKAIIPVDIGGLPCDYNTIRKLINDPQIKSLFNPSNKIQKDLGRIMLLADSAHSIGAMYENKKLGNNADACVFSFHAVKNLTTAEGGAVTLNFPAPFINEEIYKYLCIYTLHGQNKDALSKMQKGNWKYDIIEAGYKCNMTDIMAAIGLVELSRYDSETLPRRKHICEAYNNYFKKYGWAEVPQFTNEKSLYQLRIKGITEQQRDAILQHIFNKDVSVNVHFIPLPLLSFYKKLGYDIKDYPAAFDNYSREISLPVYYDLSDEMIETVCRAVSASVEEIAGIQNAEFRM